MKKILIIGIGSRIMMDDAIGIYLVEDLRKLGANPNIKYILGETDVDYCIEEVLNYDYVIVIDAFLSGKQPGEITVVPLNELNEENEDSHFSMHGVHLLNILRFAKHFPEGFLIGIEPYEISYGFTLSDLLLGCYNHILEEVQQYLATILNNMEEGKMHDTFLLNKISESLKELCNADRITKITKLRIITSQDSHIHKDNLHEHLSRNHNGVVGEWTEIIIDRQDIEALTAVIESLEGDTLEQQ